MIADPDGGAAYAIEVRRDDPATTREVPLEPHELADGEALLRIDRFALTANNVTYATLGDALRYWRFFPAAGEGWGRVPVFGFADVVASQADGLEVGERAYGYWPMATHLRLQAGNASPSSFDSVAPHRAELPGFYNRYLRTAADPGYDASREAEQMLLRPLFATSFLIDDQLADEGFRGADAVVLSSASSKTAYGTAYLLAQRGDVEVVGLTSAGNREFVEGLQIYDRVVTYDAAGELAADGGCIYVDMSGDGAVRAALHRALGDALKQDLMVGATHREDLAGESDLPGPAPEMFFAPGRGEQRAAEWGVDGLLARIGQAWGGFLAFVSRDEGPSVLSVERSEGAQQVQDTWRSIVEGRARPDVGHVAAL